MRPIPSLLNEQLIRPEWTGLVKRENNFLWLDKNENLDSEYLTWINSHVARNIDPIDLSTYPDLGGLYSDLGKLDDIDPHNIFLSTGSDGAIRTVFHSFVEPGDKVFITNPSIAMYDVYCKIFSADIVYVDYNNKEGVITMDIDNLQKQIRDIKPKLVCIPNPDSPTGTILSETEIISIHDACLSANAVLFIDEAYYPFHDYSVINLIKSGRKDLVLCRTFSKAWGLAGIRVGSLIADYEMISIMNKLRPMYEIGSLPLKITHLVLKHQNQMLSSVKSIMEGKQYFENAMNTAGFQTIKTYGNFSHVKFDKSRSSIFENLDKFVYYRKDFAHVCLKGYTRFSSAPVTIMKQVVDAINSSIL